MRWFAEWIGYPTGAQGLLMSGGSAANLTAIACARETLVGPMGPELVGYVTDQAHSSLPRAARVLGFRPDQLRVLPTDKSFRLDPTVLSAALDADEARGLRPLFVVASAGSTNNRRDRPADGDRRRLPRPSQSGCTSTPRTVASPAPRSAVARC